MTNPVARWQPTGQRFDVHQHLLTAVFGVETGRRVIIVKHLDDNTVEAADFRHSSAPSTH